MSYAGIFTDKNNIDHPITSTLYGTCSTAAATAAKEVVCSNVDSLEAGMTLRVVFTNANTAASPTINVNSKGAKNVYRFGSTIPIGGNSWEAGAVVDLFYDGTSFFMLNSDNLGTAAAKAATNAVTENSTDLVESGAVYTGLAAKADLTDLAPAFSTSTAYTVGQYVSYDGNLYKCTSAHSAGAWVAGDFTLVAVGSELSAINSNLSNKQNATDNNLQTTDKTVVGGINELKSGLTNYENQNNTNLEVANRKNILPVSLANVKAKNTTGTWTGNTYAINRGEITFTANADGYITEIVINGTFATRTTFFKLCDNFSPFETKNYILSGVVADTEQEVIQIYFHNDTDDIDVNPRDKGQGATISLNKGKSYTCYLRVSTGTRIDNNSAYPMLRETWQNATFAPYIPSVESRIEAVESGLNSISDGVAITGLILEQGVNGVIDDAKVFRFGKLIVGNIRITLNDTLAESYPLIHGLPKMNTTLAAFSGLCPVVTNKPSVVCVIFNESVVDQASLSLANGVSSEAGVLMISFSYVSV